MGRVLVLFFLFVFFSSCGDNTPKGVLSKDVMVPLLTDLHLADGYASMVYGDSARIKTAIVYKALYKKYNTDSAGLRSTLKYYTERPDELGLMYKEVEKNLTRLDKQEQKRVSLEQKEATRKLKIEAAREFRKAKLAENRLKMSRGEYDFGLPYYQAPGKPHLKVWTKYPISAKARKVDSLKRDSIKTNLLKRKTRR
ncbi:MAG: DUF4296 domain-containing protein [Sphingobacteriaceae bacterium]|nr:DUF4296 domain-containing protein [Sphingobacteriaceae bacterium]